MTTTSGRPPRRTPHPLCAQLRALREGMNGGRGLSLERFEQRYGTNSVRLGSWERGDRAPTLQAFDQVAAAHGLKLALVPVDMDVDALLAELAELQAFKAMVAAAVTERLLAAGEDPGEVLGRWPDAA